MTVAELLDRMSSAELTEWGALFRLENEEAAHQNKVAQSRAARPRRK
jgi:hypothetical protein